MVMWPVLPARLEGVYLHEKQKVLRGGYKCGNIIK